MFIIEATDSEGDSVSDELEITVHHHKAHRAFTHELTLHLQPSDHSPVSDFVLIYVQFPNACTIRNSTYVYKTLVDTISVYGFQSN